MDRRGASTRRRGSGEVDRWCASFQRLCRERGVRVTGQRLAVYRALAGNLAHPTAESLYDQIRPAMPSLSQATVYRILESLEREKLIRRVSTTSGVARFDANVAPHQHLVCRLCGRMIDVSAPSLSRVALPDAALPGFVVEELDIRIVGRCRSCMTDMRRSTRNRPVENIRPVPGHSPQGRRRREHV